MATGGSRSGMALALACLALAALLPAPAALAEDAAIARASLALQETALTATLYGAAGDVRVPFAGSVDIATERGHWVRLELFVAGTTWPAVVTPSEITIQTDAQFHFEGYVEVPRQAAEGAYSLALRAQDNNSLSPIDEHAAFAVSVFRGPLALSAVLDGGPLAPGGQAQWTLTLRNLASFDLDFDAQFTVPTGVTLRAVFPPVQLIAAGEAAAVTLSLAAAPTLAAGDYAWSVHVTSQTHPEVSASLAAPFTVAPPLAPAPPGTPDLLAKYWLPATVGLTALGVVLFFSLTEVGYLALAFTVLAPLFTRLKREKVLDNFTRGQIFGYIRANPGAHYSAIQQTLEVENGVLAYHLRVLMREDYIVARNEGVFKRFYPRDYKAPRRRAQLTRLQVDILAEVARSPGIAQRELAQVLGESKQVVSYNVGVLRDGGLLRAERRGRDVVLRAEGEEGPRGQDGALPEGADATGPQPSDLAPL